MDKILSSALYTCILNILFNNDYKHMAYKKAGKKEGKLRLKNIFKHFAHFNMHWFFPVFDATCKTFEIQVSCDPWVNMSLRPLL
jgi:hypothetical protein